MVRRSSQEGAVGSQKDPTRVCSFRNWMVVLMVFSKSAQLFPKKKLEMEGRNPAPAAQPVPTKPTLIFPQNYSCSSSSISSLAVFTVPFLSGGPAGGSGFLFDSGAVLCQNLDIPANSKITIVHSDSTSLMTAI